MCFTFKSWWDAVIFSSLVLTTDVWNNVDNPQASEISKFTSFTVFDTFPNARPDLWAAHHIFIKGRVEFEVEYERSSCNTFQKLLCSPIFRLLPSVTMHVMLSNRSFQVIVNDTASLTADTYPFVFLSVDSENPPKRSSCSP